MTQRVGGSMTWDPQCTKGSAEGYGRGWPLTECGTYLATRHFGEAVGLLHRLLNQLIVLREENMRYG
jgi:hypothetical protein